MVGSRLIGNSFLFVLFAFETGFHPIAQAVLQLTLWPMLALNPAILLPLLPNSPSENAEIISMTSMSCLHVILNNKKHTLKTRKMA